MFLQIAAAEMPDSPSRGTATLRNALLAVSLFVAFGVAGCSSESVAERSAACRDTDWRAYGVTDGRLGVPLGERQDYFQRCRALGMAVDEAAYRTGRAQGLAEYCTADTGYQVGREGRRYENVCTGAEEVAFLQGYERGREARPRISPQIGLGVGIGSHRTHGGIGIGFPLYYGGYYGGSRYYDDYHDRYGRYGYSRWVGEDQVVWHRTNRRSRID